MEEPRGVPRVSAVAVVIAADKAAGHDVAEHSFEELEPHGLSIEASSAHPERPGLALLGLGVLVQAEHAMDEVTHLAFHEAVVDLFHTVA